jgi:hypothetical protein
MAKKVKCYCGCGSLVCARTERRHRAGKALLRVRAVHAARRIICAQRHLPQVSKMASPTLPPTECSSTPGNPSQPLDSMHIYRQGSTQYVDFDEEVLSADVEPPYASEETRGVADIDGDHWNDNQLSEAMASVQEKTRRQRYPATVEDYVSDDEDGNRDDKDDGNDGFDWHAEMCEDDEAFVDRGLGVEDMINEDFEREVAEFGE